MTASWKHCPRVIRTPIVSVGLLICVVCTFPIWCRSCGLGVFVNEAIKAQWARKRLLCKTDYRALLACSRDLLRMTVEGKLKPDVYRVARRPSSLEVSQFPKLLRDLAPQVVTIDERGWVTVEMVACGFDHCGVVAYPEDFKAPYDGFKSGGQRMLIEGLWYYDDEYTSDPQYDKTVDRLIKKGERHQSRSSKGSS